MSDAAKALRDVRNVLESTVRDYSSMPFFVRPMVKRGFAKRTGRTLEGWLERIGAAIASAERGESTSHLLDDLGRLADNFRTAPERAKRGMKGAALEAMTKRSMERHQAVSAAIAKLQASSAASNPESAT